MTILRFDRPFELNQRLDECEPLARCAWPGCRGACCLHGVWLDPLEVEDLRAHAGLIAAYMSSERRDPGQWFGKGREPEPWMPSGEVVAAQVRPNPNHHGGTECVFLRADARCALQAAGEALGEHPWRFKPFHCILHPLAFDETGRITLAPLAEVVAEPASCLRVAEQSRPVRELLAEELVHLEGLTQRWRPPAPGEEGHAAAGSEAESAQAKAAGKA